MEKIAKFEKVSFIQFTQDMKKNHLPIAQNDYLTLQLPKRATKGSAGYDFYAPFDIVLKAGESMFVPTGIRCKIAEGWVLLLFPRSGLGIKYQLQLDNTVGVIDSDYYLAENEGHIMAKITNHSEKDLLIEKGKGFIQGVFLPFGTVEDDMSDKERIGGFGSTNR